MDTTIPRPKRFQWPKAIPPLDPEQQRIYDDFIRQWLEVVPQRYQRIERFNHGYALRTLPEARPFRTLELGAGIGAHVAFEDLLVQDYHAIEARPNAAKALRQRFPLVHTVVGDCQYALPYDDAFFDRVVVVHVLEHLPDLPSCLDQVHRVLKPGGILSVVLPCDPGLLYEIARKISAERLFRKRYGISYRWLARREHINSPREVLSVLRRRFVETQRSYYPFAIPIANLNLCIGSTWRKPT